MGNCINCCVMAATYVHDKYITLRWDSDENNPTIYFSSAATKVQHKTNIQVSTKLTDILLFANPNL